MRRGLFVALLLRRNVVVAESFSAPLTSSSFPFDLFPIFFLVSIFIFILLLLLLDLFGRFFSSLSCHLFPLPFLPLRLLRAFNVSRNV